MFNYTSSTIINSAQTKKGEPTVVNQDGKILIHPSLSFDADELESISVTKYSTPVCATVTFDISKLKAGSDHTLRMKLVGEPLKNSVDTFEEVYVSIPVTDGSTAKSIIHTIEKFKLHTLSGLQAFTAEATGTKLKLTMGTDEIFVSEAIAYNDTTNTKVEGVATITENTLGTGSGLYIKQHYVKDSAPTTIYGMSMEPIIDGKYDQYVLILNKDLAPSLDGPHRKRTTHVIWVLNTLSSVMDPVLALKPVTSSEDTKTGK